MPSVGLSCFERAQAQLEGARLSFLRLRGTLPGSRGPVCARGRPYEGPTVGRLVPPTVEGT